ncbi:DUF2752 domain-containing protein [Bacteroides sp.]|uniref:DUF2752 domain-containing protein n=1 Tax=Bacteroides sp. TaxID=29523 RepID=UPI00345CA503
MSPKGFYKLCTLLCVCAYIGLYYHSCFAGQGGFTPCLSKLFFHLPCPGCGTTRGIFMFLHGQPLDAFCMNPNSFLVLLALLVMTVLLLTDAFTRGNRLYRLYINVDKLLHNKFLLFPFLFFELLIWGRNIYIGI